MLLSICFSLGIGIGLALPSPLFFGLFAICACAGLIVFSMITHQRIGVCLMTTALVLGWIRVPLQSLGAPDQSPPCVRIAEGPVIDPPVAVDGGYRIAIEMDRRSACLAGPEINTLSLYKGTLLLTVLKGPVLLRRGERIRVRTVITPLSANKNPGAPKHFGDTPTFAATVTDAGSVVKTAVPSVNFRGIFDDKRASLSAFIDGALDKTTGAIAKALVLGETASLSFETKSHFRRTGCAHLLAVSGLNLGLAAALAFVLLRRALLLTPLATRMDVARIAAFFAIFPTVGFTLITGCQIPVVRACVMATGALVARMLQRAQGGLEALAIAAVAILCVYPQSLFDPGFQLSFTAVAGFFFVFSNHPPDSAEIPDRKVSRAQKVYRAIARLFRATVAANAATCPITLYHFGNVSWISPLINLIAVPFTELVIMPLLFLAGIVEFVSAVVARWILLFAGFFIRLFDGFLGWVSDLPCTVEAPGLFTALAVTLFSIAALLAAARFLKAKYAALVGVALIPIALFADPPKIEPNKLTIYFLDVGQGDSALITSPKGRHLLVDGGPVSRNGSNAGDRVVVPALRALSVSALDIVAATHPDSDHIGGLSAVLTAFPVKQIFDNGQGATGESSEIYRDLTATAQRKHVPILRTPSICGIHEFDGATVQVLHPCDNPKGFDAAASTNDNALVLLVRFRNVSALLLGDVSEKIEASLVARGVLLNADIIKSAHHGSKTSTSAGLLDATLPAFDVISVGRNNRFGMPHRETLNRLQERHIRVLRTDITGAIRFRTDGRVIEMSPAGVD